MRKFKSVVKTGIELLIHRCSLSIIIVNAIIIIINAIIFSQLIPILLNYPPDYVEYFKSFAIAFWLQDTILCFACLILTSIITYFSVREIDSWHVIHASDAEEREKRLGAIRYKCHILPYRLYLYQIIIPAVILFVYSIAFTIYYKYAIHSFLHLILIVMTFFSLTALINFLFSKMIFTAVLQRIGIYDRLEGKRISLRSKMLFQILPISIVSIIFTSMLGYSRLIEDRGDFLFKLYKSKLESSFSGVAVNNTGDIENILAAIDVEGTKTQHFIHKPDGSLITSDNKAINRFFTDYMEKSAIVHNGRIYDEAGDYNGAVIKLENAYGTWLAGVRYMLSPASAMFYFEGNFFIIILIIIFIVYLSSRMITTDISAVTASLQEIAAGWNIKSRRRIPLTSNDEIGELVLAINRIRDLELEYDTMKSEFIANISHEFRTPLNIILNALQLSAGYTSQCSNEACAERLGIHMGTMKQNCYRLLKLINNMIDSSKLEANFFKLYKQNRDIVESIRNLVISVSDYIKNKYISLEFKTNTDKKIIAIDSDAMERIILNLLSNAVKFSGKGSVITVCITDREDYVDISVRDTGIGIPEEKLQHIFRRFTQVDNMLTRSHEGSGIGLSIVKSLVEMHNGSINVTSKPGEGTEFIITLPAIRLPVQLEGENDLDPYGNKLQSGIEKINIEFSDI